MYICNVGKAEQMFLFTDFLTFNLSFMEFNFEFKLSFKRLKKGFKFFTKLKAKLKGLNFLFF